MHTIIQLIISGSLKYSVMLALLQRIKTRRT